MVKLHVATFAFRAEYKTAGFYVVNEVFDVCFPFAVYQSIFGTIP